MTSLDALPFAAGAVPVAQARDVSKRFGPTVALDGVHLTVQRGEAHALVGRNGAGKSTLVSILTGLQRPDSGEVRFEDQPAPASSDRDAWRRLVACVYQRSTIIPTLTVAENLFINRQPTGPARLISWGVLRRRAAQILSGYDVDVDPALPAADLTVEQRQLVEIARALSFGARFIVLDEPSAQLDAAAIERLFTRMRALQAGGVTFLYISHHLQEIYEVCQSVTVFRDARHIVTSRVADLPHDRLVEAMTGEARGLRVVPDRPAPAPTQPVLLEVTDLGLDGVFEDVSFGVRPGEVLGIAGSGSSGSVAVGETLVGLHAPSRGRVAVGGRELRVGSVPDGIAAGVGFVPEDRHKEGLVPLLSLAENMTMSVTDGLGRFGAVVPSRRRAVARRLMRELDIKADRPDQPVADLSGGNQQKTVMARALANRPRVLVLMDPTAGVDVRSKESLLGVVDHAATDGAAVVVISDQLEDLRRCDRVLVMFHGRVRCEFVRGWSDRELISAVEGIEESSGD